VEIPANPQSLAEHSTVRVAEAATGPTAAGRRSLSVVGDAESALTARRQSGHDLHLPPSVAPVPCGSVSKHCRVPRPARATIEAELFAGSEHLGVSRRCGISARSLVRHFERCVSEKYERARRIREQVEMFAAMGWLESIEGVMGEIRVY
jgi:hypothetical protein